MNQYGNNGNIGTTDSIVRYLFAGVVIVGILQSLLPPAMALLAAYAVFTAMVSWEPLYSLFSYHRKEHAPQSARLLARAGGKREAVHGV
jgi:hypothetical protein